MRIAVVDFAGGNLASASRALATAGGRLGLDVAVEVTDDPARIARADRIVLPGQGAFADCRRGLDRIAGLVPEIERATAAGTPFLGICVGMQLMAERGLEHRETPGFGWIRGEIALMRPAHPPAAAPDGPPDAPFRLPQIGWNALSPAPAARAHPLLDGIETGDHVYFVHSYALAGADPAEVLAHTEYGGARPAIVCAGSRCGTQFHVEKSQEIGLRLLANFLLWDPAR